MVNRKQNIGRSEWNSLNCFLRKKNGYKVTAKGNAFLDFIDILRDENCEFTESEKWIIVYYFLLNSYFDYKVNYVLNKTNEIINTLLKIGVNSSYLKNICERLLFNSKKVKKENLFKYDIFWILSFYRDSDFIDIYKNSSFSEKNKLYDYVINESKNKDSTDLVSYKYKASGQYSVSTFIDDVKILYMSNEISKSDNNSDYLQLVLNIIDIYNNFEKVRKSKVSEFIKLHSDVFDKIYNEAILNINYDNIINNNNVKVDNERIEIEKIDDTTNKNSAKLRKTSQILKKWQKINLTINVN